MTSRFLFLLMLVLPLQAVGQGIGAFGEMRQEPGFDEIHVVITGVESTPVCPFDNVRYWRIVLQDGNYVEAGLPGVPTTGGWVYSDRTCLNELLPMEMGIRPSDAPVNPTPHIPAPQFDFKCDFDGTEQNPATIPYEVGVDDEYRFRFIVQWGMNDPKRSECTWVDYGQITLKFVKELTWNMRNPAVAVPDGPGPVPPPQKFQYTSDNDPAVKKLATPCACTLNPPCPCRLLGVVGGEYYYGVCNCNVNCGTGNAAPAVYIYPNPIVLGCDPNSGPNCCCLEINPPTGVLNRSPDGTFVIKVPKGERFSMPGDTGNADKLQGIRVGGYDVRFSYVD